MRVFVLNATFGGLEATRILAAAQPLAGFIGLSARRDNSEVAGFVDAQAFCREAGVSYHEVRSYALHDAADQALISALAPDVLLVTGWQRLVPEAVIRSCGAVLGVHGSPFGITGGRGRSPQNWGLISGSPSLELSIFRITPGIDGGEILATKSFAYNLRDDIHSSYLKVAYLTGELLVSLAREGRLAAKGEPQDESAARYLPQRLPEDGQIDWRRTAGEIVDFVRALTRPYPGAFTLYRDRRITMWDSVAFEASGVFDAFQPGRLIHRYASGELLVRCGDAALIVRDHDSPAKMPEPVVFESADYVLQVAAIRDRHVRRYADLPLADWFSAGSREPRG